MIVYEVGNDEIDAASSSTLHQSPEDIEGAERQPVKPPFHIVTILKSRHRQFNNFEVILLVFDSAQAIKDFLDDDQAPIEGSSIALKPQQLVAVCLAADEEIHSRHLAVFGLANGISDSMDKRLQQLVDRVASTSSVAAEQWSIWQTGDCDLFSTGPDQLAIDFADLGEEAVKQHIYDYNNSKLLHASEGRRLAFNERWTFASVVKGQVSATWPPTMEWVKDSDDDTLLPCLSAEWTVEEAVPSSSQRRLYSKTGYCIDMTSKASLVILNRHYPHRRTAGVHFLQLVPPSIALSRTSINTHCLDKIASEAMSLFSQFHNLEHNLREARRGFQGYPGLAQGALKCLAEYVLKQEAPSVQEGNPIFHVVVQGIASSCKNVIDSAFGGPSTPPTTSELNHLLTTSFAFLMNTTGLQELERHVFASMAYKLMLEEPSQPQEISGEVLECFLILSKVATACTSVLCGKTFVEEEWQAAAPIDNMTYETTPAGGIDTIHRMEAHHGMEIDGDLEQAEVVTVSGGLGLDASEEQSLAICALLDLDDGINPDEAIVDQDASPVTGEGRAATGSEEDHMEPDEAIAGQGDTFFDHEEELTYEAESGMDEDEAIVESDEGNVYHGEDIVDDDQSEYAPDTCSEDDEDVYHDTIDEADPVVEESKIITRKRKRQANGSPPPPSKKEPVEVIEDADASSEVDSDHEMDGILFKESIICIMSRQSEHKKAKAQQQCISIIKERMLHDLATAGPVSQSVILACHHVIKPEAGLGSENRAFRFMVAVYGIIRVSELANADEGCDWVLLTLAYHACKAVEQLAEEAEEVFRDYEASKSAEWSFPDELESGKVRFSAPLVEVMDRIRDYLEGDEYKPGNSRINYAMQQELEKDLVKALVRNPVLFKLPAWLEATPTPPVSMTFINLSSSGNDGKRLDKSAIRFRETVFDVLFQAYFGPIVSYLTRTTLDGSEKSNERHEAWVTQRKFLRLRLQIIDRLVENCGLGTSIFATRACSDLVLAPMRFLPLPKEKQCASLYNSSKSYSFPSFVIAQKRKVSEVKPAANQQGWEAVYSSFKAVKNNIIRLARRKDPSRSIIQSQPPPVSSQSTL